MIEIFHVGLCHERVETLHINAVNDMNPDGCFDMFMLNIDFWKLD